MNKKELKKLKKLSNKKGPLYKNKIKMKVIHEITLSNFEFHLIELILMINFIPTKNFIYANDGGTLVEKIRLNKKFKKMSVLDWDVSTPNGSSAFRAKFLTMLLFYILENDTTIIENVININNPDKPYWTRRGLLKTMILRIDMFTISFLADDCLYGDKLFDVIELISLKSCSQAQASINNRYKEQVNIINDYFNDNDCGLTSTGLLWHTMIRLAYIMIVGKQNMNDLPKFNEHLINTDVDDMKEIIGRLGIAIFINSKKKKISPIYTMWRESGTLLTSCTDGVDENPEIKEGVIALNYLAFLIDNDDFTEYIRNII